MCPIRRTPQQTRRFPQNWVKQILALTLNCLGMYLRSHWLQSTSTLPISAHSQGSPWLWRTWSTSIPQKPIHLACPRRSRTSSSQPPIASTNCSWKKSKCKRLSWRPGPNSPTLSTNTMLHATWSHASRKRMKSYATVCFLQTKRTQT